MRKQSAMLYGQRMSMQALVWVSRDTASAGFALLLQYCLLEKNSDHRTVSQKGEKSGSPSPAPHPKLLWPLVFVLLDFFFYSEISESVKVVVKGTREIIKSNFNIWQKMGNPKQLHEVIVVSEVELKSNFISRKHLPGFPSLCCWTESAALSCSRQALCEKPKLADLNPDCFWYSSFKIGGLGIQHSS